MVLIQKTTAVTIRRVMASPNPPCYSLLIPLVVSLLNPERNRIIQSIPDTALQPTAQPLRGFASAELGRCAARGCPVYDWHSSR